MWIFGRLLHLFGSRGEYICFDINPSGHAPNGDYARGLWQQLYRGCVIAGPLPLDDTTARRIHDWGVPYLVLSRLDGCPELSCATVDFEQGAYESTRFLIERGHRRIAMLKAFSMMGFGLYVLGSAVWAVWNGRVPDAPTMGVVALLALLANVSVAWLLYAFREGDANMRSVWLCSRNDAIGNVAVFLAALGVFGTGTAWPDLLVAALMAGLALHGGWQVLRQARGELGTTDASDHGHDHHGHAH